MIEPISVVQLQPKRLNFGTKVRIKKGNHRLRVGEEGEIVGYSDNWSGCYVVRGLEESQVNPQIKEDELLAEEFDII